MNFFREKRNRIHLIITLCAFGVFWLINLPAFENLPRGKIFLMKLASYNYLIAGLILINLFVLSVKKLERYSHITIFILTLGWGYALAELAYRSSVLVAPGNWESFLTPAGVQHLNQFFLHRIFHAIPLGFVFLLFFLFPEQPYTNFIRIGNLRTRTGIINPQKEETWEKILVKFAILVFAVITVIFFINHLNQAPIQLILILLAPIFLYAFWNCFVEESLFRGVLLSVFSQVFSESGANWFQAILFALVHYDPTALTLSLIKIGLFTFLGWFFGRATLETRGIGTSFVMHTLLVTGIEVRLLV
ncbi:MAG: CPBP family intramembrane glutamic endopeptidase [Vulcanimicrobiota bacterium]